MAIPTQLSLQGFIATEPQLSFGESALLIHAVVLLL